jgi:hypothetical protein
VCGRWNCVRLPAPADCAGCTRCRVGIWVCGVCGCARVRGCERSVPPLQNIESLTPTPPPPLPSLAGPSYTPQLERGEGGGRRAGPSQLRLRPPALLRQRRPSCAGGPNAHGCGASRLGAGSPHVAGAPGHAEGRHAWRWRRERDKHLSESVAASTTAGARRLCNSSMGSIRVGSASESAGAARARCSAPTHASRRPSHHRALAMRTLVGRRRCCPRRQGPRGIRYPSPEQRPRTVPGGRAFTGFKAFYSQHRSSRRSVCTHISQLPVTPARSLVHSQARSPEGPRPGDGQ